MAWQRIHLCTGLLERDGRILVVANRYPNLPQLLWGLPGGRQESQETADRTVIREFAEETGLTVRVAGLAYVAESFDASTQTQFTAFCFRVAGDGEPRLPHDDLHVRDWRWVNPAELATLLSVRVVREPLLAYLADRQPRYFGFAEAGITIAFADAPSVPDGTTPPDRADTAPRRRDDRE
jgi:ADP-ribose pyrophosphatase YjhB (NUDIX family)